MRGRLLLYALLVSPGLIPLLAPYLPFQDWPGHLGVIGSLIHLDDPAARIQELVEFKGWWGPNRLLYWLGTAFGTVFGPTFGGQLVLAIVLATFGPALAWLCRAAGVDERLALFGLPLALGRHIYCGFALNGAGLVCLACGLAAYLQHAQAPSRKRAFVLVGVLALTPFVHGFFYLVTVGLLLWCVLVDLATKRWRSALVTLGAQALSFLALLPQLTSISKADPNAPSLFTAVTKAAAASDRSVRPQELWEWLFASYRYETLDDTLQTVWLVVLGALLVYGLVTERQAFLRWPRVHLLLVFVVTGIMFWWLPSFIGPPLNWWGGNLRLPMVLAICAVPLVGLAPRPTARIPVAIAALCGLTTVGVAAYDLLRFNYGEMSGLEEVVDAIPPGQTIAPLHYTPKAVREYPGEPHGYVGNYYMLRRGGLVPQNLFEVKDLPFARRGQLPAPPWGIASAFAWSRHGAKFDGFLVRIDEQHPERPFRKDDPRVRLVKAAGVWRYYARRKPGDATGAKASGGG